MTDYPHQSFPPPGGRLYLASNAGKTRCEVSAAMEDRAREPRPFEFDGERLSLDGLRRALATAALTSYEATVTMNEGHVWLRTSTRFVQFDRTIRADGVSVIGPDWIEE